MQIFSEKISKKIIFLHTKSAAASRLRRLLNY